MHTTPLGQRMFECNRKMKHLQIAEALGLMPQSELFAMGLLLKLQKQDAKRSVSMTEIAQKLHVSMPAISRTFKHLEEKGYAKRFSKVSDRRSTFVTVTQEGQDALKRDMTKMSDFMDRALSHLEESELETYFALSDKIHMAVQAELQKLSK